MIRSALMTVMTTAAIKAGRGLKRDFGEIDELQVSMKGPGDFVSLADKRAEKTLYEELAKARPGYGFVMEEGGRVEGSDKSHTWHIDPLDATTNFLHAIPMFAISIALEREGQIVAGVIYNPADDDMYVTEKGQGAFGRNRRLRVAGAHRLVAGAVRLRHSASRQVGPASALQGGACGGDDASRQRAPHGLRLARSRLCRRRPFRRLLGARPEFLGHRRGRASDPRGRRLRDAAPTARPISSRPAPFAAATRRCIASSLAVAAERA